MNSENSEEFYSRLKEQLKESSSWPAEYLYKFIVPTSPQKIKKIENVFASIKAKIELKQSKSGKYTSISIRTRLYNPDAVIHKYKEVSKVKGVISL